VKVDIPPPIRKEVVEDSSMKDEDDDYEYFILKHDHFP